MKRYTFLEVAGILGVTKNVIKSRSKKMPGDMLIREGGIIYVDETGLKWFKTDLKNRPINQRTGGEPGKDHKDHSDHVEPVQKDQTDLVKSLADQIALLTDQLEKKDQQIAELNQTLKREQEISLHNALMLKDREETILKLEADTKKPWFSRVFSRSK